MKDIIPHNCPNCNTKLDIKEGKSDGILKLYCSNDFCQGSDLKKLYKSVSILNLKGIGEKTIEKLFDIGVNNIIDVFDKNLINKENLINSGYFKEGKNLDNLLKSLSSVNSIRIDNFIHSLQIDFINEEEVISIGETLSYQIGRYLSGIEYDFKGLSVDVRNDIFSGHSKILMEINNSKKKANDFGIKIEYLEDEVKTFSKKEIQKNVSFDVGENDYEDIVKQLNWKEVDIESADLLVVDNKNKQTEKIEKANNLGIKIITLKQLKILFL